MKKILSLFTIVSLLFAACELQTPEVTMSIKLTSKETINVSHGNAMAYITYELTNPVEGATVEASANVGWIGDFDHKQMGKIVFNIEKNPEEAPRSGEITVTYNNSSFKVTVNQNSNPAPTKKEISMPHLMGSYFGIQGGMYNYYLVFSDIATNNDYYVPNAKYYMVDIYLLVEPEDKNNIKVPLGEYTYDLYNSGIPNTFVESWSWYQINNEDGFPTDENQTNYESGKITIEEGKITLNVTLTVDGIQENHIVTYEGDYSLKNEEQ